LIRDDRGIFVQPFSANIGDRSITRAELRAIVEVIKMAWAVGVKKLNVQTDSSTAVSLLFLRGGNCFPSTFGSCHGVQRVAV
ncbi:hypothetical protein LINPERPRIM_LOCUS15262, partial [Linum perenne]